MSTFRRRARIVVLAMLLSGGVSACGRGGIAARATPGARDVAGGDFEYEDRALLLPTSATKVLCDRTRMEETNGGEEIGPGGGTIELYATIDATGARPLVATLVVPQGAVTATTRFTVQMPRSRRALVYVTATRDGAEFRGPFREPLSLTIHYGGRNCRVNGTPAGSVANIAAFKSATEDGHPDPDLLRREGGGHVMALEQVRFLISSLSGYILAEG